MSDEARREFIEANRELIDWQNGVVNKSKPKYQYKCRDSTFVLMSESHNGIQRGYQRFANVPLAVSQYFNKETKHWHLRGEDGRFIDVREDGWPYAEQIPVE